jgi:peptidoglycan/LPS O-acetylase OafA/YrhL
MVRGAYYFAVISCIAPAIVYLGSMATPANERSRDLARFLGWLSYPIYCLHFPVIWATRMFSDRLGLNGHFQVLLVFAGLATTLIVSVILTKFYDEPVRGYVSRKVRTYFQSRQALAVDAR